MLKRAFVTLLRPVCSVYCNASSQFPVCKLGYRSLHSTFIFRSKEKIKENRDFERLLIQTRKTVPRKRRPVTAGLVKNSREPSVVSIVLSESLDLQGITQDVTVNNLYNVTYIDEEFDNALLLVKRLEYTIDPTELSEVFVFQDGAVVCWNIDSAQRAQLLREIERFMENPYESTVTMEEQDVMPFTIVDGGVSGIKQDRFILDASKHGANNRGFNSILERFAFSQGFAASVKVGMWESLLSSLAEPLSETTKALTQGIIPWTRKEALIKSGEFAALRHSINVDCNLLNRDFYWERSELEQFYHMSARHFNLNRRLSILNGRLDYCEELVKMVDNMLALRHASTLEWMIIALIVIEVIFDIFHYVDHTPQKVIIVHEGRDENIHSLDKII